MTATPHPMPTNDGLVGRWAVDGWRVRSIRTFLVAVGTAITLYGVYRIAVDPNAATKPVLKWLVGGDLAHDLVIAPVTFSVAFVIRKTVKDRLVRSWLAVTLAVLVMVLIVSIPVLGHQGRTTTNETYLQQDYLKGFVITELVVVVLAGLALPVLLRRRRS